MSAILDRRFEDVLTILKPQRIINLYCDTEETDVTLQEELIGIGTKEELKIQFGKGYQQFRLQKDIPDIYPVLLNIARLFSSAFKKTDWTSMTEEN